MKDKIIEKQKEALKYLKSQYSDRFKDDLQWQRLESELAALESEPAKELYEKIYIRDEKDLPREGKEFVAHDKINNATYPYCKFNKDIWMDIIDWYLKPLK